MTVIITEFCKHMNTLRRENSHN